MNAKDQFNWTPLHHACHAGQLDIMELLVDSGSQVDTPALNGATPLMRAIESCRPACVEYLIKAGAKVNAKNKKGRLLYLLYSSAPTQLTCAEACLILLQSWMASLCNILPYKHKNNIHTYSKYAHTNT